jgi:hypothetical protein
LVIRIVVLESPRINISSFISRRRRRRRRRRIK